MCARVKKEGERVWEEGETVHEGGGRESRWANGGDRNA